MLSSCLTHLKGWNTKFSQSEKPCDSCRLRQLITSASLVCIHPVWGMKKDCCEKKERGFSCKLLESQFSEIQYFQDFKYFNSITSTPNEMITSRGVQSNGRYLAGLSNCDWPLIQSNRLNHCLKQVEHS